MRSPKLAAIGVATLSGLIPVFLDPTITPTIITPKFNKEDSIVTVCTVEFHREFQDYDNFKLNK